VPRLRTAVCLLLAHVLCAPVWLPWLSPQMDFHLSEDSLAHLIRLYHLSWLVERGVWYPRWVPDMFLGYGYPLFNFYAPGFYYLAWFLGALLRLDTWEAYRAGGLAACLVGLTGMFLLARRLWGRLDLATFATVCFGYLPYVFHLLLYRRGDPPELFGLSLIPWLLLAIVSAARAPGGGVFTRETVGVGVAGAAVVLAHNLTAVTGFVLATAVAAVLLALTRRSDVLARLALGAALAAGLTAGFWLPVLAEARLVQLESLTNPGTLDWRTELIDPAHPSERALEPANRQTHLGVLDLHVRYPNQIHATPKPSLAQGCSSG
jgi:uncharacterized membrane protein